MIKVTSVSIPTIKTKHLLNGIGLALSLYLGELGIVHIKGAMGRRELFPVLFLASLYKET